LIDRVIDTSHTQQAIRVSATFFRHEPT
jgi:hypothetical protein